jgi:hypothetical protein
MCSTISLEYYDILNNLGCYSTSEFLLDFTGYPHADINSNIAGCDLTMLNNLDPKKKIQPFIKEKYTIIYNYDSTSSIFCQDQPGDKILNVKYFGKFMDQYVILPVMKDFLNRGVPLRLAIKFDGTMNSPNTFNGIFSKKIIASSVFPNVDDNEIITENSYNPLVDSTASGHVITICGYSDINVKDGSTGVFKVINSWGQQLGNNGYAYISYNYFFKPVSQGGLVRNIIAFE